VAKAQAAARPRNERLQPLVVETRRGALQFTRILETLARLEMTDGFTLPEMLVETSHRLPRDATVIAVLSQVTEETAIALAGLKRSGYAVTAVLAMFGEVEHLDWAEAPDWASRLLSSGVDFRRVDDEQGIANLCAEAFVRA